MTQPSNRELEIKNAVELILDKHTKDMCDILGRAIAKMKFSNKLHKCKLDGVSAITKQIKAPFGLNSFIVYEAMKNILKTWDIDGNYYIQKSLFGYFLIRKEVA